MFNQNPGFWITIGIGYIQTAMSNTRYIIALDQGTTSSRAIVYDLSLNEVRRASRPLPVQFPKDGWVEQKPEDIWNSQLESLKEAANGIDPAQIAGIGITNQRETVVAWDKKTGAALSSAIVWQCRRSSEICKRLRDQGLSEEVKRKTGLVLDPYFSGTKVIWMLENIPGLREKVKQGTVVFGTMDSWVLYKLTGNLATEPSNASRTLWYSLETGAWDSKLLSLCGLTETNVPSLLPSNAEFGITGILGAPIPITGILGDQQASLYGHGCFDAGSAKCTFGTGAFLLANTGSTREFSSAGLLSTVAWAKHDSAPQFALEGAVFVAGSVVQWLRDKLGILKRSEDSEAIAASVPDSGGVFFVPAFVGLGAPHWDDAARGTIIGLTRDSSAAQIVRAALESVAHQVADVLEARNFNNLKALRIDGGMSQNRLFCQMLADLTGRRIEVTETAEVTARGAALMALSHVDSAAANKCAAPKLREKFEPHGAATHRISRDRWKQAVKRSLGWGQ